MMAKIVYPSKIKRLLKEIGEVKSCDAIKDIINDFIKEYSKTNVELKFRMQTQIESNYPDIKYDESFQPSDYSRIEDIDRSDPDMSIYYAYYLLFDESSQTADNHYNLKQEKKDERTFECSLSPSQLETLCEWMIRKGLIEKISFKNFQILFSNQIYQKVPERLMWIPSHRGHPHLRLLVFTLVQICGSQVLRQREKFCTNIRVLVADLANEIQEMNISQTVSKLTYPVKKENTLQDEIKDFIQSLKQGK